jgi:quercetin dioxygenase-like cupin family protein
MITRVERSQAAVTPLPGRTWFTYIGPERAPTKNVTVGVSVFPAGSKPTGHVHDLQDETVYVVSGHGRLVTPDATADLEPGVAVLISPGTFHATEADDSGPLELVCLFSPPVVPGSYEHGDGPAR